MKRLRPAWVAAWAKWGFFKNCLRIRLKEQLEHVGAFSALIEEIRELKNQPGHPLRAILSTRGIYAYEPPESVPNWSDDAVKKSADDLLGRTAFARFLAKRIASISPDSDAYAMHIYAPWGAG